MSKFYVLDENNNKSEALDKQGVLALLAQAIADGSLNNITADAAFISKIKCCVGGDTFQMAFINQAKYNELKANGKLSNNVYYIITDDTSAEDLNNTLKEINESIRGLGNAINALEYQFINKVVECSSLDANKEILINGFFALVEGTEILVKFASYGGADQWHLMSLNVNNTGAKEIRVRGESLDINVNPAWAAGDVVRLYFDGTYWNVKENLTQGLFFGSWYTRY